MGDNMLTKQSMVKKSSNGKDTLHASEGSSSLVVKSRIQKSIKASKNHHFGQVAVVKTLLQKNDILVLISMLMMCPSARRTTIFLSDWFGSDCFRLFVVCLYFCNKNSYKFDKYKAITFSNEYE